MRRPVTIDPRYHDAVIFDLDGVVTDTAAIHAAAWVRLFDEYLARRPMREGEDHSPFSDTDYQRFIDGKPRLDGVADFLASRGITLPWGSETDDGDETVCGLGNRKQQLFLDLLSSGVPVFHSTVDLVRELQGFGIGTGIFSSSRNLDHILRGAGIADLFPVRVDGLAAMQLGLPGKPHPAVLLETANRMGVRPNRCVVIEDSEAGVAAGRRGGFALVIGVDRGRHAEELLLSGADVVVTDVIDVAVRTGDERMSALPDALDCYQELGAAASGRQPAVLFDFDGTLSDIVDDPNSATLVPGAARALQALAEHCPVAVVSGRGLADIRARVGLPGIWYAGSHGFELTAPDGTHHQNDDAVAAVGALQAAAAELRTELASIDGIMVEDKRFSVAVHYRNVADAQVAEVSASARAAGQRRGLRITGGRKVVELRPNLDWDKGKTLDWIAGRIDGPDPLLPIYIGDDLTDEDAFDAVRRDGVGIVVRHTEDGDRRTAARFALDSPDAVRRFIERLADQVAASQDSDVNPWSITFGATTRVMSVCEKPCAPPGTVTSPPVAARQNAGRARRTIPAATPPVCTTGSPTRSPAASSTTKAWSTSRTGCR